MPDPYSEGRKIRRAKIFERAGELRYTAVKYEGQRPWLELSDADRKLWVDVQRESYDALLAAMAEQRYTMLEFVLDDTA